MNAGYRRRKVTRCSWLPVRFRIYRVNGRRKPLSTAEPLTGEKTLNSNLNSDQLATLQVRNSGDQPLWLRVDASGYPQSAPLPANNVLQIERHILGTDGKSKSLDSLRSGDLVLVWLQVKASNSVPDALVVDLLPAGLELENQNLANGSARAPEQSGGEVQNLLNQMQQAAGLSTLSSVTIALWRRLPLMNTNR